jgi:vancomycin resistance protein VanW
MGSLYFSSKRFIQWYLSGTRYATKRMDRREGKDNFPNKVAGHQSPLIRQLRHVDLWLQRNKVRNLQLAIAQMDGLVLRPGETMSMWRLIGRPSKWKGYLPGMVLINGDIRSGYGGGLCQLSNLIYWMTLHTELTVTERFRHQYDVFPDANRTLPFGSGATIAYNYIDLQIRNDTKHDYYLCLEVTPTHLVGEWRCTVPARYRYEIVEKNHHITQHTSGKYLRHNQIWRRIFNDEGVCVGEECVAENHAIMMYSLLLMPPETSETELFVDALASMRQVLENNIF